MKKTAICLSLFTAFAGASLAADKKASAAKIVKGKDSFEFTYRATLPEIEGAARLWLPIAESDRFQKVELLGVTSHKPWRFLRDEDFGNRVLTMTATKRDSGRSIEVRYRVVRSEKASYRPGKDENVSRHLRAESLVPRNETLTEIARKQVAGLKSEKEKGEKLYLHTLGRMAYDKSGQGWGRGDAMFACDSKTGNCTDFHAYFIGLARAVEMPARFAIGFTIPADRDEGEIGGYHCWAEFHADGKWTPVDISEADKHPELAEYYHGRHPANRFQLTMGRDLKLNPGPRSGPFNYLIYPMLETKNGLVAVDRKFSFKRLKSGTAK